MAVYIFESMSHKLSQHLQANPEKYSLVKENINGQRRFQEMFKFFWNLPEAKQFLHANFLPPSKSIINAESYIHKGDQFFDVKDFDQALSMYNHGILEAPHPMLTEHYDLYNSGRADSYLCPLIPLTKYVGAPEGRTLSLAKAFAKRAYVMYELKNYKKCIADIEKASKCGYPPQKQKELDQMMLSCLEELEKASPKKGRVPSGACGASPEEVPEVDTTTTTDYCERLFSIMQVEERREKPPFYKILNYKVQTPPRIPEINENVPVLSKAIEISSSAARGRCLRATRDIALGEVLGVEEANSVCMVMKSYMYCSTCFRRTSSPLPCPVCSEALYCSEACRIRALTEEHWLECALHRTMVSVGLPEHTLIYKTLKTLSYNQLKFFHYRLRKEQDDKPETLFSGFSTYRSLFGLCTNKENLSFDFLFIQCQIVFIIVKLLVLSERFFVNSFGQPIDPSEEDIMNTGAVLLYHAAQLYCNLYKVTDFQAKETAGIGVYSALSLINHSCYPSVKHYFIGRSLVMRAVRPISAGEELTISYIKPFQKAKKQERKILLQRYWFSCTCEACVNDWPTFPNLPALRFKCLGCKNPLDGRPRVCYACVTKRRDPDKPQTEQMEVVDSIWRGILNACCTDLALNIGQKKTREDYLTVCQNLQLLYEHVAMPCQHVIIMHQLLYKYFEDEF